MVDLIKYTGLTGLSGSIFSLVDITGLFLFYDLCKSYFPAAVNVLVPVH